jgi:hypothetical protein
MEEDRGTVLDDDGPTDEQAAKPQEPAAPRKKRRPFD